MSEMYACMLKPCVAMIVDCRVFTAIDLPNMVWWRLSKIDSQVMAEITDNCLHLLEDGFEKVQRSRFYFSALENADWAFFLQEERS